MRGRRYPSGIVIRCLVERNPSVRTRTLALAAAACVSPASLAAEQPATDLGTSLLQVGLGLTLVLALIFGALFVLKRITAARGPSANHLRVVGATALGARERIVLVEIGETWLVVGVAPGHISALHNLPRLATAAPDPGQAKDFGAWLARITERNRGTR